VRALWARTLVLLGRCCGGGGLRDIRRACAGLGTPCLVKQRTHPISSTSHMAEADILNQRFAIPPYAEGEGRLTL